MELRELLTEIRNAPGPSRTIDAELGRLFGYAETNDGRWISPRGELEDKVPYFTLQVDDAAYLASLVEPDAMIGCSWEPGMGSAKLGDGRYYQSFNPATALCIAVLAAKFIKDAQTGP